MSNPVISDHVKYIGCSDRTLDLFESQYVVPNGMAYNSYLILDEKVAVMDTADQRVLQQWFNNLQTALAGRKPDYLIISHMEPDHSAGIRMLCEAYPEVQLVASSRALWMLPRFFKPELTVRRLEVKDGETLSLGTHTLHFIMTPMVHWPEVMMTYESSEKLLFSADGFGKFGAMDADEDWACEARRYYMNIVGKYGAQVQAVLKKAAGLQIKTICPLHGPVLTGDLTPYLEKYDIWSSYRAEDKGVTIACASIHGNTAAAARHLASLLEEKGEKVSFFDLCRDDMAEAIEDAFRYDRLVLAAPTYDGALFPAMEDFLYHLKIKNYQNRTIGIVENGSWAPVSGKLMNAFAEGFKNCTVVEPMVTIHSALDDEAMQNLTILANALAY